MITPSHDASATQHAAVVLHHRTLEQHGRPRGREREPHPRLHAPRQTTTAATPIVATTRNTNAVPAIAPASSQATVADERADEAATRCRGDGLGRALAAGQRGRGRGDDAHGVIEGTARF